MYENYAVLFVDDEVNILSSLRRGLMDEEYRSFFANSGREALKIMEENEIHLIVSDMRMPEMTGLELLKIVAQKWPKTVKVVLSGYTQLPQILVTINQVDIFKFVTKPWTLDDFDAVIKKSLDFYMIQEENINYQKILEKKNISYQNILKKMEDVINEAKKSSETLGLCGKAIFGFEKKYSMKERIKFQNIFSLEEDIFEIISHAVVDGGKTYNTKEIEEMCIEVIKVKFPSAKFDEFPNSSKRFEICANMFKASISIILMIFKDEFVKNGIMPQIKCESKFKLSIISPKVQIIADTNTKELSGLNVKMDFAQRIMSETLSSNPVSFQILIVDRNLVIGFSIKEKES